MSLSAENGRRCLGVAERWVRLRWEPIWVAWAACSLACCTDAQPSFSSSVRRLKPSFSAPPLKSRATSLRYSCRHPSTWSHPRNRHGSSSSSAASAEEDDWSSIEVEVLQPEVMPPEMGSSPFSFSTTTTTTTEGTSSSFMQVPSSSVQTIETVDPYAKAKVMNFIRRQQQQQKQQQYGGGGASSGTSGISSGSGEASSSASSASSTIPEMEVREVQGAGGDGSGAEVQFHARWRLPLPPEYGERFGEGFASTAKEAENVAAMHAERVIDALGFPLFLLSSKQRKHAEAARAAGRWAPMPAASSTDPTAPAEIMPPPETPSPPPLRLHRISAREQQERQLHIDKVEFTPVEKKSFAPLSCTLASPYYFDPSSVRRIESFYKAHRTSYSRCMHIFLLQGGRNDANADAAAVPVLVSQHQHAKRCGRADAYLAQLTLPLPPRFGIRVAMGRGPTKRDAVTLACMHAELIIDAIGCALYPTNPQQQALHAEECARVRRWCAPPGDCDYRYTVASPAPLELVGQLDASAAAAAARASASSSSASPTATNGVPSSSGSTAGQHPPRRGQDGSPGSGHANTPRATDPAVIQVGTTSASCVESILLQHHNAVAAMSYFTNEVSMRDYENARLLLERYVEPFIAAFPSVPSGDAAANEFADVAQPSPLRLLMFVEMLGQRDRPTYRATITVPLADADAAAPAVPRPTTTSPLPYTHSFVAIGVADTSHIAELAASLHALRTLAALNRLTLLRGSPAIVQALESFAVRGKLPLYKPTQPMLYPADVPAEEPLPAAVRVMEGVVGRVNAPGLLHNIKEARAQVFSPGMKIQSNTTSKRIFEQHSSSNVLQRYASEGFLMQALKQARARVARLDWDTTADAQNRIVVAPDANPRATRHYVHTLGSVRNPDDEAWERIRDYLERHGKTFDMVSRTKRVRVAEEAGEDGYLFVTTAALPLPDFSRRRILEDGATAAAATKNVWGGAPPSAMAEERESIPAWAAPAAPIASSAASAASAGEATSVCCLAQGEAPTREESLLLCCAHAELLLDALGVPLYDNAMLQCKHADAARALGRWAPLARGGLLAPAALRPIPPPLRKVTKQSALWAEVERARHAVTAETNMASSLGSAAIAAATEAAAAAAGADARGTRAATNVNDDVLCDVAHMRFVHESDISVHMLKFAIKLFDAKGLDFCRVVRQYKLHDAKYGTVHRAIAEMPIAPIYGTRYAVGVGDTKRQALMLSAMHAMHILDALKIPFHTSAKAQLRYARKGAIKGVRVPLRSDGRAPAHTPTPPGYYSLKLSEAAIERPPFPPVCPRATTAADEDFAWKTYVHKCETYRRRLDTYVTHKAVTALPVAGAPRSGVPAEDAMLDRAEAAPLDMAAQRLLRELGSAAGLPSSLSERIPYEGVKLSTEKRAFLTVAPLYGTPYNMRGFSAESGPESRRRAFMHGVELIRHVVRANSEGRRLARCGWAEGLDRTVSVFHPLSGEITHHGRVWVLRMWSAMHSPPRALQVVVREEEEEEGVAPTGDATKEEHDTIVAAGLDNGRDGGVNGKAAAAAPTHTEPEASVPVASSTKNTEEGPDKAREPRYHASVLVVEQQQQQRAATPDEPKVVAGETHTAAGRQGKDAVQGAVHRIFFHLQRTPTMQALHRFLSRQPQLHFPSLRTLRDPDGVVQQLLLLPSAQNAGGAREGRAARVPHPLQHSLLLAVSESLGALPMYDTWPVQVLLRWVRAHRSVEHAAPDDVALPRTLAPLFVAYGLVADKKDGMRSRATGRPASMHSEECAPSCMADTLASLCHCLPPPPPPPASPQASVPAPATAPPQNTIQRDRTLPLQLAHLLLMGLLLDCAAWTVRLAAMVVCAEDTLTWYMQARHALRLPHSSTPPANALPTATSAQGTLWACASVDVVEAVLLSASVATAVPVPPLPVSVQSYECEVSLRMSRLSAAALHCASGAEANVQREKQEGRGEADQQMDSVDALLWATLRSAGGEGVLTQPPLLSGKDARTLRPILQCAVAASAAPHEVWVRAGRAEEVVRDFWSREEEEAEGDSGEATPTSAEVFLFQGRRTAAFAALCVDGTDLTRGDVDTLHTLSSMITCFIAFGCAVPPVGRGAVTGRSDDRVSFPVSMPLSATVDRSITDDKHVVDEEEGDAEKVEEDEEKGDSVEAQPIDPALFTRVLGTCVTQLGAMVVGQRRLRTSPSASCQSSAKVLSNGSALNLVDEDLPMLMAAFNDTVPLLVPSNGSAAALQQLAAHFRSRIESLIPFTAAERSALCQLLTLPVEAVQDDGVDDA